MDFGQNVTTFSLATTSWARINCFPSCTPSNTSSGKTPRALRQVPQA